MTVCLKVLSILYSKLLYKMGQDFFKQTLQYFIYFKSAASLSLYCEEDPEQVPVQEDPEQVSVQDQAGNHVF